MLLLRDRLNAADAAVAVVVAAADALAHLVCHSYGQHAEYVTTAMAPCSRAGRLPPRRPRAHQPLVRRPGSGHASFCLLLRGACVVLWSWLAGECAYWRKVEEGGE